MPAVVVGTKTGIFSGSIARPASRSSRLKSARFRRAPFPGRRRDPLNPFRSGRHRSFRHASHPTRRGVGKRRQRRAQRVSSAPRSRCAPREFHAAELRRHGRLSRFRRRSELGQCLALTSLCRAAPAITAPRTNRLAFIVALVPRERFQREQAGLTQPSARGRSMQRGTPYVMYREAILSPLRAAVQSTPAGRFIGRRSRDWRRALGSSSRLVTGIIRPAQAERVGLAELWRRARDCGRSRLYRRRARHDAPSIRHRHWQGDLERRASPRARRQRR